MAGPSHQPFISFSAFFEPLLKLLVLKRPNPLSSSYCKWLWTWFSTHSSACVLWAVWQNKWKFCNKQKNSCRTAGILRKKKSISGAESRTKNTGQHLGSGLKLFLYLLQSFCKMFVPVPAAQGHLTATVTPGAVPQPLHDLIQNAEGLQLTSKPLAVTAGSIRLLYTLRLCVPWSDIMFYHL